MTKDPICPVCHLPAPASGRCVDLGATHYECPGGHHMCGYEGFWRKDGKSFCGKCGSEMRFANGKWTDDGYIYGWCCPRCREHEYRLVFGPEYLYFPELEPSNA